jgi:amidase
MALPFPEYDNLDGLALAKLVRDREVTPLELVEAAVARIEASNSKLNAVIHPMFDVARRRAATALRGPFAGVPMLLKDALAAYAGEPMASGSRALADYRPERHSYLVERFLGAGAVVVGKTNVPELVLTPVTEPDLSGPTRNPWNLDRTAGGSSGGSAAAVAARWVPIASGGDGGGSIRMPSSCCGVFGLKPSRGRNPCGPFEGAPWEGFSAEHVITRSVRDSAAMLDATAGPAVGEVCVAPAPERPFLDEVGRVPGRLRIGITVEPVLSSFVHPDCQRAADDTAELLQRLGHEIVRTRFEIDGSAYRRSNLLMMCGIVAADVRDNARRTGKAPNRADYEPATWWMRTLGETFPAGMYAEAIREQQRLAKEVAAFVEPFDAWLTPTLALPPLPIGALRPPGIDDMLKQWTDSVASTRSAPPIEAIDRGADAIWSFMPYTSFANAAGLPSMSVPLHQGAEGLPIGVLFTARYGDEATLFRLAAQLEAECPWAGRIPPMR